MAARFMARTPSPPAEVEMQAPGAPRFGYQDDYHPYPKRSTRSSTQRNRTPSPSASRSRILASPRGTRSANNQSNAAMVSPVRSPRKKRQPPVDANRRSVSGSLTAQSTANAAKLLGSFDIPPTSNTVDAAHASSSRSVGMLPTPSKTPSKPPSQKQSAEISTFARNLFPSDAHSSKRVAKSHSGLSMDSFTARNDEHVEVFTDTKDSIPEIDTSDANPFYTTTSKPEKSTSPRRSQRKIMIPGEEAQTLDEATRRGDGAIYVFRGKKFYRKFADEDDQDIDATGLAQPLTRSSVNRLLRFPAKQPETSVEDQDDEEAPTDVEDNVEIRAAGPIPQTPTKSRKESVETPKAPKYAPISPPETRRTTRSTNKLLGDETPIKQPKRQPTLFDKWPRTKEHKAPAATKRIGDALAQASSKRTRT